MQLGGELKVFFRTSQGARYVDQLVNGVANESKVGYQTLAQNLATQISKDAELILYRGSCRGTDSGRRVAFLPKPGDKP